MFIAKYTKAGLGSWVRGGGGPGSDSGDGIGIDSAGNIYCTGVFTATANFGGIQITEPNSLGAMFTAKYNKNGTIQWINKAQCNTPAQVKGLALWSDLNGFSYVTGFIGANATFGTQNVPSAGGEDVFVAKYSPLGKLMWASNAGGSFNDRGLTIAGDQNGIATTAGIFINMANFGGNPLNAPLPTYKNYVTRIRGQNVGVGIGEAAANDLHIRIYPNPAADQLNYNFISKDPLGRLEVRVYDSNGSLVLQQSNMRSNGTLLLDSLSSGNYILEVRGERSC